MEFFGLLVLYFLVIFFVAGFVVVVMADRRDTGLAEAWRAYAKRHRYTFSGRQSPDRAFRIVGSRDGIDFRLETDTRRGIVTRLLAHTPASHGGRVVASLGGAGNRESDGPRTATGDAAFDGVFDVRASEARVVEIVLGPEVRAALQRFPTPMIGAGLRLVVDGDEALVEWAGGAVEPSRLEAAHAILRPLCASPSDATGSDPRPTGV
ncbi:MAG: hypothetical protein ABSE49_22605 [Polyangiaceae bacterium]